MRRKRFRKFRSHPTKVSKKKIFFLVLVLITFISLQSFIFLEKNLKEPLMEIAKMRVRQMSTQAIHKAITEQVADAANVNDLIEWRTDRNNKVTGFMFEYSEHMKITADAIHAVQSSLDELERTPEKIPIGQALNSAILASFGPDVTVRFLPAGAVHVDLNTRQMEAGINMLLVEVFMRVTVEVAVLIPFATDREVVQTEIPISYMLVVGDVPMYYFDNKGNPVGSHSTGGAIPPTISLPDIQSQIKEEQQQPRLTE